MDEQELSNRLATAKRVLENALERDNFIFTVNDSSHRSAEEIGAYVTGQEHAIDNEKGRQIARDILKQMS
ncbi:hypothetical protein B7Z17_03860 [Candidatus Saccharibacteria bacterium 32-49-10]|nr:MAG: hypothetical protein B7Z17_03860 [Candidatus Saccharibacteria bacterium 32-49-10]